MLREFKAFAMRGNVVDMAVGIILGTAFGTIVKSPVSDVLMPPIGLILGNVDFSNLFLVLSPGATPGPYATVVEAQRTGAVTLNYGGLHQHGHQLPHRGVCHVLVGALDQSAAAGGSRSARRPHEEGVPLLFLDDPDPGHALPAVHLRTLSARARPR